MVQSVLRTWDAFVSRVAALWSSLNLAGQFIVAAAAVMVCVMTIFGLWLDDRLKAGIVHGAASGAALYINSVVEPHLQDLSNGRTLRPEAIRALDALSSDMLTGGKVVAIKVWAPDGTVLYSDRKAIVGKVFPVTKRLAGAWKGTVSAQLDDDHDESNTFERSLAPSLLEIYAPVRERGSDRIIAVVEFYQVADQVQVALQQARGQSSLVVVLVTLAMLTVLFAIVRRGSRTIESQQKALHERISQLSALLAQNEGLRRRIDDLYLRSAETHEGFLRRVGHDLHDGPAQLIAFALLRIEALQPSAGAEQLDGKAGDYERIKGALMDALGDIRNISAGLLLPELEAASPAEVLRLAARNHERRTGTRVRCEVDSLPMKLSPLLKSCLYRFTQAALNNAYQHAGGNGQAVSGTHRNGVVEIAVSDAGPGFLPEAKVANGARLGLISMRDRVVSLGGTFDLSSKPGAGTRLTARFEVTDDART